MSHEGRGQVVNLERCSCSADDSRREISPLDDQINREKNGETDEIADHEKLQRS
uniref:Uncharacterized protein n=1 Tax=Oryza sativa subsp. japonica TaxID=39947 RepID=Q6Z9S2_ORYSJ|nr:hypothetical protein [Oryza sativa Japonica Group]